VSQPERTPSYSSSKSAPSRNPEFTRRTIVLPPEHSIRISRANGPRPGISPANTSRPGGSATVTGYGISPKPRNTQTRVPPGTASPLASSVNQREMDAGSVHAFHTSSGVALVRIPVSIRRPSGR
jgi:hypothetical protein